MRRILVFILFPLAISLAQTVKIPKEALVGYQSISATDLSARLHFIASPELEGREATFRGQKIAARYIASVFQQLRLKPVGDNGTYFQQIKVEATRMSDQSSITIASKQSSQSFLIRKDFYALSAPEASVTASAVFIGYMDATVDSTITKGKIVVALPGRKLDAKDTSLSPMRRLGFIRQFAGSVATFVVADESGLLSMGGLSARFGTIIERGTMQVLGAPGRGMRFGVGFPILVSPRLAAEIFKETGRSLSQLRKAAYEDSVFVPIALNQTSVALDISSIKEIKTTENVLGLLEGSDPKLKDELVTFTAHFDHVGIAGDGVVFPGADDDGSGTVTVLELAEAFTANAVKPKRSLLFMTVTGEEKGLWGSDWYVKHPVVPLEKTVANLNIDMIGRLDTTYEKLNNPNYVYVIGSDKISTELDSVLKVSNKQSENLILDYKYNDDKDPERFYSRSDHYNFARNGVPIVFFFTGVHADYHRPTDTVDKIHFPRMEKIVRLIYWTGWQVANAKKGLARNVGSSMYTR